MSMVIVLLSCRKSSHSKICEVLTHYTKKQGYKYLVKNENLLKICVKKV